MTLDYLRHVFEPYSRIPEVVWIDKDDGALLVATCTGVTEHCRGGNTALLHLFPEGFEKLTAAPSAAASFAGGGAHEDLAELTHAQILCRGRDKSNLGIRFQRLQVLLMQAPLTFGVAPYGEGWAHDLRRS
jgi:hypothetical protein